WRRNQSQHDVTACERCLHEQIQPLRRPTGACHMMAPCGPLLTGAPAFYMDTANEAVDVLSNCAIRFDICHSLCPCGGTSPEAIGLPPLGMIHNRNSLSCGSGYSPMAMTDISPLSALAVTSQPVAVDLS